METQEFIQLTIRVLKTIEAQVDSIDLTGGYSTDDLAEMVLAHTYAEGFRAGVTHMSGALAKVLQEALRNEA